jgi:hypothetical protein
MPGRRFWSIVSAVVLSLVSAAFGVYVLHRFQSTAGLLVGTAAVALSLAVAFPTQFHEGLAFLRAEIVPAVLDAMRGTKRSGGDS